MNDIKAGDVVRLTGERWGPYQGESHRVASFTTDLEGDYEVEAWRVVFADLNPKFEWLVDEGEWAIEKVSHEEVVEGSRSLKMDTHDTEWNYYMLPSGVEARDVSQFLSSFAGQIVQYAVRSGRMDGKVKSVEDRVRDFEKIADFARWEADRLLQYPEDV